MKQAIIILKGIRIINIDYDFILVACRKTHAEAFDWGFQ